MLPLTSEWIMKAEGDYTTMLRVLRARNSPNYDAACFHAQQCAEKYLKARLQEEGLAFPKLAKPDETLYGLHLFGNSVAS